mgnify:CR=1 FL=1
MIFSVRIFGFEENTNYKMKIFAEQMSTGLLSKAIELSFTTKRSSIFDERTFSLSFFEYF